MLLIVLFVIGITAEGVTGALAAGRERMDLFGVAIIACMTAIGGGSVRDVLLGNYPLTWVEHPIYLVCILLAALITVAMPIMMTYFHRVFLVLDAIGLSVFTVLGTQIALELGHGALIAMVAAVLTGVFGGVLRDVMSDRVPLVFQGDMYASVAVSGSLLYLLFNALHFNENVSVIITLIFAFSLRLCAMFFHWSLPVFEYQEREINRDRRYTLSDRLMAKARVARPAQKPQVRITRGIGQLTRDHKKDGTKRNKKRQDADEVQGHGLDADSTVQGDDVRKENKDEHHSKGNGATEQIDTQSAPQNDPEENQEKGSMEED